MAKIDVRAVLNLDGLESIGLVEGASYGIADESGASDGVNRSGGGASKVESAAAYARARDVGIGILDERAGQNLQ